MSFRKCMLPPPPHMHVVLFDVGLLYGFPFAVALLVVGFGVLLATTLDGIPPSRSDIGGVRSRGGPTTGA